MADDSTQPEALNARAVQAAQAGRLDIAIALMNRAILARPHVAAYHRNLGEFYRMSRQFDQAISSCKTAVRLEANSADSHFNLGIALKDAGNTDEAIAAYRHAVKLDPAMAKAFNNLGSVLRSAGRFPEAIAALNEAIRIKPDYPSALNNLALALREIGELDEAASALDTAIRLKPDLVEAHINLSNVLAQQERSAEALAAIRRAVAINPRHAPAQSNLGIALTNSGRFNDGLAALRAAVQCEPQNAEAHFNLSMALLRMGDFATGWREYEWRAKCQTKHLIVLPMPPWDGGDIAGKTILVHSEQGLGDAIQFVRYCPLIAARGGRVILECRPELRRLFAGLPGVSQIVSRESEPIPNFHAHCPMLSIPLAMGTRLNTIPVNVPYLSADPTLSSAWTKRLAACGSKYRVGLVWAGNPEHVNDKRRSLKPALLAPLAQAADDVCFISLQKNRVSGPMPAGLNLIDFTAELTDFADTAALVANLDLVIAVDTAVAHLAGTMGKPVWLLLPFVPDWRWLMNRDDSPWYPSMQLFRQSHPDEWAGVLERVAQKLAEEPQCIDS